MSFVRGAINFLMFLVTVTGLSCADQRFKSVYPATGTVTYLGKPTPGATVRFLAEGPDHPWTRPVAVVDEKGEFTVTTYKQNDGIPAGRYNVMIYWTAAPDSPIETSKLPARYANPKTSNLVVEIKPEPNVLSFELTK